MKQIFIILILTTIWCCIVAMTNQDKYVDPTGTYNLESKTTKKGDDVFGYSGQIQVETLTAKKIVMIFYINKGAPSYNSGSFADTLDYINNKTIYTDKSLDSSCVITFNFTEKGVTVDEKTEDYNFGCGFGHAVVANGFFKKTSSKKPILRDPKTGEDIK